MEGQKLTTITGKTFICQEVIKKQGKTYYRDDYILWGEDKIIKPCNEDKPGDKKLENGKSKKVHSRPNRIGAISRNSK